MKIGDKVKLKGGNGHNTSRKHADKLEVVEIFEQGDRVKAAHFNEKEKRVTEIYVAPAYYFEAIEDKNGV